MVEYPARGRGRHHTAAEPAHSTTRCRSWQVFAVTCVVCAVLGVTIWMSARLQPSPALHDAALFVHLASLVLGFGAVLAADYFIVLWLVRRSTFAGATYSAARLHLLIWVGLTGLVLSGALLEPDLASWATRAKLAFVVVLTLNGLQATIFSKRLEASTGVLSVRLLACGAVTTTISQTCWWGSVWIGFWTTATNV